MAIYQVILRVGWIFKTESIIMPAFMDLIGGAGWQRGCLPMLNRLGQSLVPLLLSDRIRNVPLKKVLLCSTSTAMGVCFLILTGMWWFSQGQRTAWWPVAFLAIYALFFTATGLNRILYSTLTGKLIVENYRGRLAAVGSMVGGALAIAAAWFFLRPWMQADQIRFGWIFGLTGVLMIVAGLSAIRLIESRDTSQPQARGSIEIAKASWKIVFENANFRLLAIAAALFGMSMTLFPHYQSIARHRLGIGLSGSGVEVLLYWIIAQHVGAAVLSIPAGGIADRFGNRMALQVLMGAVCVAPVLLLVIQFCDLPWTLPYLFLFFLLGLTPITFRFFNNYALETTDKQNHPAYLSTLGVCFAMPVILSSTLVGGLIDVLGLETVFVAVTIMLLMGWSITFRLEEPRFQLKNDGDKSV